MAATVTNSPEFTKGYEKTTSHIAKSSDPTRTLDFFWRLYGNGGDGSDYAAGCLKAHFDAWPNR